MTGHHRLLPLALAAVAGLSAMGGGAALADPPAPPAPAPPQEVTLDDVLRLLRDASPRTIADRAQVGVAESETVSARLLPNPSFDYSGSWLTGGTNTGAADVTQLSLGQPLLVFGQRAERRRVAGLDVDLARSKADESYADRARQAREAFAALLAGQEKVRLLQESRDDLDRVAAVVRGRAEAGDKSRYDALRIDLELRQVEAELSAAQAGQQDASGRLAALVGLPRWRPHAAGDLKPAGLDISDPEALWRQAEASRPSLVTARRNQVAAREAVTLARRERLPIPTVSLGAGLTRDAQSDSLLAGLSVPVTVFDRGQGEIARATAQAGAADLELQASTAEARADLERAVAVLGQRRETLARLETDVMSRLPEMRRMAEDAYREGQADILELLDALRSRTSASLLHLDDLQAVIDAETDLLSQIGRAAGEPHGD